MCEGVHGECARRAWLLTQTCQNHHTRNITSPKRAAWPVTLPVTVNPPESHRYPVSVNFASQRDYKSHEVRHRPCCNNREKRALESERAGVASQTYAHDESVETSHHPMSKRTRKKQRCKCVRVSGVWTQPGDPEVRRIYHAAEACSFREGRARECPPLTQTREREKRKRKKRGIQT